MSHDTITHYRSQSEYGWLREGFVVRYGTTNFQRLDAQEAILGTRHFIGPRQLPRAIRNAMPSGGVTLRLQRPMGFTPWDTITQGGQGWPHYTRTFGTPVEDTLGWFDTIERERGYCGQELLARAIREALPSGGVVLRLLPPRALTL